MIDSFPEIQWLEREGNFNGVIQGVAENYSDLGIVKFELLKRIGHYLERFRGLISPQSIGAIRSLPESDLHYCGLTDILDAGSVETPGKSIGRIPFPVVTSAGLVREILVTEGDGENMSPGRLQVLDRVGAAVFRVLKERLGRRCLWKPERFFFRVLDPYGRDDPDVQGDSLSLPLALALYSRVTDTPVPPELSATAALGRDGSIGPVVNIQEKLATLNRERFFIKQVLISDRQERRKDVSDIEVIKVQSLKQAISIAFPGTPNAACFSGDLDIDTEIRSLNNQYDSYLIDTCLENAGELIRYLELKTSRLPRDKVIPALFTCSWKKGACHCHKGEVKNTQKYLEKALGLYKKYPGVIRADDYFDARISYAVLLKDIFRYEDAETLHLGLVNEMEKTRSLDHVKGKNLSTLSQLHLAMGRFEEAEKYQRQALQLINEEELCRNYGYLAQIYTRKSNFRKAGAALREYKRLLKSSDDSVRGAHMPFYHWIKAEYLYTRVKTTKKGRGPILRELLSITEKYPEPGWWVPALIHKFSGLALLLEGRETRGLEELQTVINYFSSQFAHVLRLLGASVRAERGLYFFLSGRQEQALEDVRGIIEDLSLQKDIKRFFRAELSLLSRFLRSGNHRQASVNYICKALENIKDKIPY